MNRKQKRNLIRILVTAALLIALHFLPIVPETGWIRLVCYVVPYIIIGYDILRNAVKGIINRQPFDESLLMAIATVGAFVLAFLRTGDYLEAVAVMLFYQVGEWFQAMAVGKSRRNISELMDIRPDVAYIETEDGVEEVDPDDVEIGTIILVRPGEKVPIDGVVVEGESRLNTAALTGESVPRAVRVGDEIISGSVNESSPLRIETTKEFGESTASKILELVENASSRKSQSEKFISKFARVYTPVVVLLALALAIIPPVVLTLAGRAAGPASELWGDWIYRALTFLVMSCPCALVISIPLSFFAGLGGASREGVLIKGSNYLETLSNVRTVVFDKTGTLTKGVFEVSMVHPAHEDGGDGPEGHSDGHPEEDGHPVCHAHGCADHDEIADEAIIHELLHMAAHAERYSNHPIAASLKKAYGNESDECEVGDIEEVAGHGVRARINGSTVCAGNAKMMTLAGCEARPCEMSGAGTIIHVAIDGRYAGHIVISDIIKEHSAEAIQDLHRSGVKKTVMLTGDARGAAEEVGGKLGVDVIHAELLPADKVTKVEELLEQAQPGEKLAFVGDGINDAPVLSRADIGIAMGAMGSDAAIESADVVLMDDDPIKIGKAIRISRKCMRIVKENITIAIAVKVVCLILGALGIANMWFAIFADVGVMIIAVLNAIRALFVRKL
ncbi:MAG: HAD-IC family P-type ATPase [Lachnospiraceae bacterium]|nr:HAD-IC family P-type ATPase [Lachnospiraceae bacterium]MBQ4309166.1 HAD-IC family P-type ATPase [Lachnospiraceae bacterium]